MPSVGALRTNEKVKSTVPLASTVTDGPAASFQTNSMGGGVPGMTFHANPTMTSKGFGLVTVQVMVMSVALQSHS